MAERRRLTRWSKSIECSFNWDGRTHKGVVSNLSFSGLRVHNVGFLPPVDSVLLLSLEREETRVNVKGRVVYAKGISLGIEFEEPRGVLMKRLATFVQRDEGD